MPRVLAMVCLLLALTACDDKDPGEQTDGHLPDPKAFPAESPAVPHGFREVLCPDLRGDGTGLTVRLVVPVQSNPNKSGDGCSFAPADEHSIRVRIDPDTTLAAWRKKELDPFEDIGGDDEVGKIAYRGDVPGLAGEPAEELSWWTYSDGSPSDQLAIQAAGVRLSWSVPEGVTLPRDSFDIVRRSIAVIPGTTDRCPSWGPADQPTLSFAPPTDIGWIQREDEHCRIYLDGATTLLEYGIVDPAPGDLTTLAARARNDPEVTDVRIERGVARIDGETADRLTWTVVRTKETENYEPAGSWQIVVTQSRSARIEWGATPEWWAKSHQTYDDLVASVRVLR